MAANTKTAGALHGFTLIELLIAISVFAIMAAMAYGGLSQIIRNNTLSEQSMARVQKVQRAVYIMTRDFNQIIQRDIRDELGTTQPYLISNTLDYVIEFTRNGRRNPAGFLRSNLQRVAYQLKDHKLYRLTWPQLDRVQGMEPDRRELLDNVEDFTIRYLDASAAWHTQWPPLNNSPGTTTNNSSTSSSSSTTATDPPAAIEVDIQLKDWGEIKRLYNVGRL
jgi:general secretion pathway protein J